MHADPLLEFPDLEQLHLFKDQMQFLGHEHKISVIEGLAHSEDAAPLLGDGAHSGSFQSVLSHLLPVLAEDVPANDAEPVQFVFEFFGFLLVNGGL